MGMAYPPGYCQKCGKTYGACSCARDAQDAELTKLKSDVERLKAALKPFADCAKDGNGDYYIYHKSHLPTTPSLTMSDLRNAARALEETK